LAQVKSNRVVGDVKGKTCIITDDMIDTGGTIAGAVKLLKENGATTSSSPRRTACCPTLRRSGWPSAEPVSHRDQHAADHRGQAVPAADRAVDRALLASTIRAVFDNGSVTSLFDGSLSGSEYITTRVLTSRKTLDLLRDNGIEPEIVQYLKTPPSRAELEKLIADAGIDVRTAVRKRESLYTELGLAEASDDQLLDAMAEHPILIERPFVVTGKGTRLARPIDAVREIL